MQAGLTDQQFEAGLIASDEFYKAAENFDSTPDADDTTIADLDQNADWVDAVYKLLLGRTADAGGEAYWTKPVGFRRFARRRRTFDRWRRSRTILSSSTPTTSTISVVPPMLTASTTGSSNSPPARRTKTSSPASPARSRTTSSTRVDRCKVVGTFHVP